MSAFALAATSIALVHATVCLVLVVGGPLGIRHRRVAAIHMICFVPAALINLAGFDCPLTIAENWARERADVQTYDGGFIEHYVTTPLGLGSRTSLIVGALVVAPTAAALVYRITVTRRSRATLGSAR